MRLRFPVVLLCAAALAAPGGLALAKDKEKGKGKDKKEEKSDDRRGGTDDGRHHDDHDGRGGKITICHVPPGNHSARHTITVGESAWGAHQRHGDHRGACGHGTPTPGPGRDRRFDAMDTNDDGVISLREWRGDRTAFDRLDRDDNGVLTRDEFYRS
jgi:hypothetical protein